MSTVYHRRKASASPKEAIQRAGNIHQTVIVPEPIILPFYFKWRGALHWTIGAVLLVLAAPIILVTIIAVTLSSPGSPVYRQRRVGKNGCVFTLYKIRSMRLNAEEQTGPVWTTSYRDARITPLGRILRY